MVSKFLGIITSSPTKILNVSFLYSVCIFILFVKYFSESKVVETVGFISIEAKIESNLSIPYFLVKDSVFSLYSFSVFSSEQHSIKKDKIKIRRVIIIAHNGWKITEGGITTQKLRAKTERKFNNNLSIDTDCPA